MRGAGRGRSNAVDLSSLARGIGLLILNFIRWGRPCIRLGADGFARESPAASAMVASGGLCASTVAAEVTSAACPTSAMTGCWIELSGLEFPDCEKDSNAGVVRSARALSTVLN